MNELKIGMELEHHENIENIQVVLSTTDKWFRSSLRQLNLGSYLQKLFEICNPA